MLPAFTFPPFTWWWFLFPCICQGKTIQVFLPLLRGTLLWNLVHLLIVQPQLSDWLENKYAFVDYLTFFSLLGWELLTFLCVSLSAWWKAGREIHLPMQEHRAQSPGQEDLWKRNGSRLVYLPRTSQVRRNTGEPGVSCNSQTRLNG